MKEIKSTKTTRDCPASNELVEYFRHALTEAQMAAIDEHFGECEKCLETTRTVFETLVDLDSWNARTHGEAIRREALIAGLELAGKQQAAGSAWAERLRRWRGHLAGASAGAIELVVSASGARIMARTLAEFVSPEGMQFEPAMAVRGRGERDAREGSADVLSVGDPACRIHTDERGKTQISVERWPTDCPTPGVLVIEVNGGRPPLLVELAGPPGGRMVGEFDAPAGEYMVLFAPAGRADE